MTTVTVRDDPFVGVGANTDLFVVASYATSNRQAFPPTPTELWYDTSGGGITILRGEGFTYDRFQNLEGGTITGIEYRGQLIGTSQNIAPLVTTGLNISVAQYVDWGFSNGDAPFRSAMFGGDDVVSGGGLSDLLRAYGGADSMFGGSGDDTLDGGQGPDTVSGGLGQDSLLGGDGTNYLRGDEGDDRITGGSSFDDANGNMGNDTMATGAGDDWAVGGKDNDSLSGEAGGDVVWGNLGNDTQAGGDGNDQVRGGQGDDTITGGAGDDFVSGDRGNDTIVGGAGADIFHGSQDAGIDRVLDFNFAEGDRVRLDPGTVSTTYVIGDDLVIHMGGNHEMILVGAALLSLPAGWLLLD